ncbi:hypothetical protein GCM10010517_78910 [Streptosporangium fragile]|uniref:DUF4386 family protein n=1 Tax=Streptosporangium fragile TaxID=46186 RepID=A0ABN3WGR7_9ACTN
MDERSWERVGAASGLAAAMLLVVAFVVAPGAPGLDARTAAVVGYLGDRRAGILTASLLVTLAAVAFLWFVAHLRHVLQRAEGGAEAFSPVVLVSGVSLATVCALSMVPLTAMAMLIARPVRVGDIEAVRVLYGVHQLSIGPVGLLVALFAVSTGAAMVRRELAGPWLGWAGMAVAVIGLIAGVGSFFAAPSGIVMFLAYVLGIAFALWIAAASVVMLLRPEVERVTAARGVFAR